MRNFFVFAIPNLQTIDLSHLIQHFQFLDLKVSSFILWLQPVGTGLILETMKDLIHDAGIIILGSTFIALSPIIVNQQRFIMVIALWNVIDMRLGRHLFAAWFLQLLPLIAVDDVDVFDVQVVRIQLISIFLILIFEQLLHLLYLSLGVNHVDPLLTSVVLADHLDLSLDWSAPLHDLQSVVLLILLQQARWLFAGRCMHVHVLLYPIDPDDVKSVSLFSYLQHL